MALKELFVALSLVAPATAVLANTPDPALMAPAGTADTRYCMRIEALTGSRIETIECWTRAQWAEQGVDVDKDWAEEGVGVKG